VARFGARDVTRLMKDAGIVRNRLKILSAINNAKAFLAVAEEHGTFDAFIWSYVKGKPLQNPVRKRGDIPARTELSDRLSKDLRARGFTFVGTTIVYAFMQAGGLVNDHTLDCFRRKRLRPAR
jgi:DNA-3-methyladenine glycosylase I